jgi:hypothetical protein
MDSIGVFSPEQARELWHDYLQRRRSGSGRQYPIDEPQTHRVLVKNTTSEAIPPFACMRVIGTEVISGRTVVRVEKPSSTVGEFLFNSHFEIAVTAAEIPATEENEAVPAQSGIGWAFRYGVVLMRGAAPTEHSVSYGPIVGSWEVEETDGPFVIYGVDNTFDRCLVGRTLSSGGTGHHIWFEIVEVLCAADDTMSLVVIPTWYTGGCTAAIPGEDSYGEIEVIDPCSILQLYTAEYLESGVMGRATYMYPRNGYCEPEWLLDTICGQPECA